MARPRRIFSTPEGKLYYLIDGKKRFIKTPKGVSQKQIAKINIKNIVNVPTTKRVKRRRKRVAPVYGSKVGSVLQKSETGGLPIYFFQPQKKIPTLEEQAKVSGDTNVEKLTKELLKGLKPTPSSSKIAASISTQTDQTEKMEFGTQTERKSRKKESGSDADTETVPKKQISVNELVNIIGEVERRGITVNLNNVKGYIDEFYKTSNYTGITSGKFNDAKVEYVKKREKEIKGTPPSSFMSPPPPRPAPKKTGVFGMKDFESETESEAGSVLFERGERARGMLESESEGAKESKSQGAKGTGDDDGLYNDEIEKVVKKRIKNYVPVIASDQINDLTRYVGKGDKRFGFVINTNPSSSDGSGNDGYRTGHWRAVYINNEDDYPSVEYFDPLAEGKMPQDLQNITRKIALKMNPSMMFKYKQNMLRRQSKLSSNCGWHAIKFLDDRYNGIPWSEATGYDSYMEQQPAPKDDSSDGESDISKYIKKYESYI